MRAVPEVIGSCLYATSSRLCSIAMKNRGKSAVYNGPVVLPLMMATPFVVLTKLRKKLQRSLRLSRSFMRNWGFGVSTGFHYLFVTPSHQISTLVNQRIGMRPRQ